MIADWVKTVGPSWSNDIQSDVYIISVIGHCIYEIRAVDITLVLALVLALALGRSSGRQYDSGMEQRPGDPGGDGDQFPLPGEDFYLSRLGKFRQIDGTAAANQRRCSSLAVTHGNCGSSRRG